MSAADEPLTPAERRLDEHLALLRDDAPAPRADLVRRVTRTARWQDAVRKPLQVVGAVARAALDAFGLFTRRGRASS